MQNCTDTMMNLNKKIVIIIVFLVGINCSTVLKSNGTAGKDLNAQTLIELGRELNEPLVTMIGMVIENYHTCMSWTQWTECSARKSDFFSTRTRTRQCAKDKLRNGRHAEIEISVCEGKPCPTTYNTTANGFCIKLYTTMKTHDEAGSVCQNDGGFLINIDSDLKYADVKDFMITNDEKLAIHIDGWRKNATSQWEYAYGSRSGYFHWYKTFPITNADHLCLDLTGYRKRENQRFLMYNDVCSKEHHFLCEVLI
ncbi:uncharacterized protein LOC123526197 [Mercenaria mercenaria]|uniref:uncharacterized protein LOC123526197 n=1 Tax=Mercenaria mercenaria TaxID=6596 RepID=UPI00234E8269|nr:uncharacterized protein LOC123526197 [Mercenaria mercenaria]